LEIIYGPVRRGSRRQAAMMDDYEDLPSYVPAGLPRTMLSPFLLKLINEKPSRGCDLLVRLFESGYPSGELGAVYRLLRVLEQERLIESEWRVDQSGASRRTYWLSPEGSDWLLVWEGSIRDTGRLIERFLHRCAIVHDRGDPETE